MSQSLFIYLIFWAMSHYSLLAEEEISFNKKAHKCIHSKIKFQPKINDLIGMHEYSDETQSLKQETEILTEDEPEFKPLRIQFDVSGLGGLNVTKREYLINEVLPQVEDIFATLIQVRRYSRPMFIYDQYCYIAQIPKKYGTQGFRDADVLIFVTYDEDPTAEYLAWATACLLNPYAGNRPLAGQINFAAVHIDMKKDTFQMLLDTAIHELIHVLVFSPGLESYFIDEHGRPSSGIKYTKQTTIRGVSTTILTYPKVAEYVRQHFNCPDAEGAELENEGDSGSKGAHWERRVFFNELMTASLTESSVFSKLTLALFESSGWYRVDYSKTDALVWGKNAGCSFLNDACIKENKSILPGYFCTERGEQGCSFQYKSRAVCMIFKPPAGYPPIPASLDYFSDGSLAADAFSDNCPYMNRYRNGGCTQAWNVNEASSPLFEQYFGSYSRCFTGDFIKSSYSSYYGKLKKHSACLRFQCQGENLVVFVGTQSIQCPIGGGKMKIQNYVGFLDCPDPKTFCFQATQNECGGSCNAIGRCFANKCHCPFTLNQQDCSPSTYDCSINKCSGKGTCVFGKCQCDEGWGGFDCSRQYLKVVCSKCQGSPCRGEVCYPNLFSKETKDLGKNITKKDTNYSGLMQKSLSIILFSMILIIF